MFDADGINSRVDAIVLVDPTAAGDLSLGCKDEIDFRVEYMGEEPASQCIYVSWSFDVAAEFQDEEGSLSPGSLLTPEGLQIDQATVTSGLPGAQNRTIEAFYAGGTPGSTLTFDTGSNAVGWTEHTVQVPTTGGDGSGQLRETRFSSPAVVGQLAAAPVAASTATPAYVERSTVLRVPRLPEKPASVMALLQTVDRGGEHPDAGSRIAEACLGVDHVDRGSPENGNAVGGLQRMTAIRLSGWTNRYASKPRRSTQSRSAVAAVSSPTATAGSQPFSVSDAVNQVVELGLALAGSSAIGHSGNLVATVLPICRQFKSSPTAVQRRVRVARRRAARAAFIASRTASQRHGSNVHRYRASVPWGGSSPGARLRRGASVGLPLTKW